jgi:DNA anti-recombination protein RmuC
MEAMRQSWTDDRLDEFGKRIDERFDRVDERFEDVDRRFDQVDRRFDQVDRRFEQVDRCFEQVDTRLGSMQAMMERRFDTLQYSLIYAMVGMFGAMAAVLVAVIVSQS